VEGIHLLPLVYTSVLILKEMGLLSHVCICSPCPHFGKRLSYLANEECVLLSPKIFYMIESSSSLTLGSSNYLPW